MIYKTVKKKYLICKSQEMPKNGRFKALLLCRCDNFVTNDEMPVFCWGKYRCNRSEERRGSGRSGSGGFFRVLCSQLHRKFHQKKNSVKTKPQKHSL